MSRVGREEVRPNKRREVSFPSVSLLPFWKKLLLRWSEVFILYLNHQPALWKTLPHDEISFFFLEIFIRENTLVSWNHQKMWWKSQILLLTLQVEICNILSNVTCPFSKKIIKTCELGLNLYKSSEGKNKEIATLTGPNYKTLLQNSY